MLSTNTSKKNKNLIQDSNERFKKTDSNAAGDGAVKASVSKSLSLRVNLALERAIQKESAWKAAGLGRIEIQGSLPSEAAQPFELRFSAIGARGDIYDCRAQYNPTEDRVVLPQFSAQQAARPAKVARSLEVQAIPSAAQLDVQDKIASLKEEFLSPLDRFAAKHTNKLIYGVWGGSIAVAAASPSVLGYAGLPNAFIMGGMMALAPGLIGGALLAAAAEGFLNFFSRRKTSAQKAIQQGNTYVAAGKFKKAASSYAWAAHQGDSQQAELASYQLVRLYAGQRSPKLSKAIEHYLLRFPAGKHASEVRAYAPAGSLPG